MDKIPKRPGQKLNGVFPSVFALAFLLVGVPFASTFIVNSVSYYSDDAVVEGYTRNDVTGGPYPFYEASGDGTDAKCQSNFPLNAVGSNCVASFTTAFPTLADFNAFNDTWYQGLTGCANGNTQGSYVMNFDCGDSGYRISQNITQRATSEKIFPNIEFKFQQQDVRTCDWNKMGSSKVDYTITLSLFKRDPIWQGTNIWMSGYIADSFSVQGTSSFNSSRIDSYGTTFDICQSRIYGDHNLDLVELQKLSTMIDDYYDDQGESFGIFITIELDNMRRSDGVKWSQINYYNPFHGDNSSVVEMYLDFTMYDVDPLNTFVKFGIFFMGLGFWLIAIASTPYWDPFVKKYNEVRMQ